MSIEIISEIIAGVVVVATIVARITPSPKDDEQVSKVKSYLLMILRILPTFGVNPETKRHEKALKESKDESL